MFAEVPKFEASVAPPADAPVELSGGRKKGAKNRTPRSRAAFLAEVMRIRNSLSHRQRTRGYKFKHLTPRTRTYRAVVKSFNRSYKRSHPKNCPKGSRRMANGNCERVKARSPSPRKRSPSLRRSSRARKSRVRYTPSGGEAEAKAQ